MYANSRNSLFVVALVLLCSLAVLPPASFAGELKIVDSHGLVRALKVVKNKAQVVIELKSQPSRLSLVRSDGISGEIQGQPGEKSGVFLFEQVGEGVWQMKDGGTLSISSVSIIPQ